MPDGGANQMIWGLGGRRKEFGFYYKCDEKPLERFQLQNETASFKGCLKADCDCHVETG